MSSDILFAGSVPELYDTYLVPLIFEPYARDVAERLASWQLARVLEVAAGTGVLTRAMAAHLPESVSIVATDLNQPMIDQASLRGTARPVTWRQADAVALPFDDGSFDAVVCQFGVMFFPDRAAAYAEARRVLRPGGVFIFNTWDRLEENDFAEVVTSSLAALFPDDPPRFLARRPHGYHDRDLICKDLEKGGFRLAPVIDTIPARSRAASSEDPAIAYCQGTPLRSEIEERGPSRLAEATGIAAASIADRFGRVDVDGKIQAHVVTVDS